MVHSTAERRDERSVPSLLPTTVVGSYPQPGWLINRQILLGNIVPRVSARDYWRIDPELLQEAQDAATLVAIRDMERAGIDIITDGEIRRDSYSTHFMLSLEGIDESNPAEIRPDSGPMRRLPRIVGPIRWTGPVEVPALRFLRSNTDRKVKVTLPGPFTMSQLAQDEYYREPGDVAMAFAEAVNREARALEAAGADVIQLDEPYLRNDPEAASRYGIKIIDRALEGLVATTVVHLCFGYGFLVPDGKPKKYAFLDQLADSSVQQISIEAAQPEIEFGTLADLTPKTILLGVLALDLASGIETKEVVAERIRRVLPYVPAERLIPAPDCGMKYLERATAFAKLKALSEGAAIVRRELLGSA